MVPPVESSAGAEGPSSRWARLLRRLERIPGAWLALVAVVVALLVELPTLSCGIVSDDHVQYAMVRDSTRAPWDLFSFYVSPADTAEQIRVGRTPWFIDPRIHQTFFRPLASISHYVDYRFFGARPWVAHAHSLLWFAALLATVAWLFLLFEGRKWTAGLATLVYALSPPLALSATWLAGRNVLVATGLGMAALGMHHAFRRGRRKARAGAIVLFALALTAGECSAGPFGYLVAYAAVFDKASGRSRLGSVLPYVALGAAYWGSTLLAGYGVRHYALYVDLHADIVRQLPTMLDHVWRLFVYEFGWGHLELLRGTPFSSVPVWAAVLAIGFGVALSFGAWKDRTLRFWFVGAMVSSLPFCLTLAQPRLLASAHVGYSMAIVRLLSMMLTSAEAGSLLGSVALPGLLASLAASAGVGTYCLVRTGDLVRQLSVIERVAATALGSAPGKDAIVSSGSWVLSYTPLLIQRELGMPPLRTSFFLSGAPLVEMDRTGPSTLIARAPTGLIGSEGMILVSDPMPVGTKVRFNRGVLEVLAADPAHGPTEARFEFDAPLEDSTMAWFATLPPIFNGVGAPPLGTRSTIWFGGQRVVPLAVN